MLVAMVTAPGRPAWAMISASFSWYLALSTLCSMPALTSSWETYSELSIEAVPTSTGRPLAWHSLMSVMMAPNFSSWVR
ncbi:hypothetical protein D3C72_2163290 [compost metagenome]